MESLKHSGDRFKISDNPQWGLPCASNARIEKVKQHQKDRKTSHKGRKLEVVNVQGWSLEKLGYKDLANWLENDSNVYIGRNLEKYLDDDSKVGNQQENPTLVNEGGVNVCSGCDIKTKDASKWGNPFKLDEYEREECIRKYETHARENLIDQLHELQGKTLGCWCHPQPCHGDVLVKLYNEYFVDS